MSDVIHRTNLINFEPELLISVNTPDFPTGTWIINPDLSLLGAVPRIHWKIVVDAVLEMTTPEKDAVNAAIAADELARIIALLKALINADPLVFTAGQTTVVGIAGLVLTTDTSPLNLIVNNITTVVADPDLTKFVTLRFIFDTFTDTFELRAYERTTGAYAPLGPKDKLIRTLGEWSVGPAGATLTLVI